MAKHDDIEKDLNDGEDEDLLGFDFDEDLLGEEEEVKEKEEETIDLVDALLEDEGGVQKNQRLHLRRRERMRRMFCQKRVR